LYIVLVHVYWPGFPRFAPPLKHEIISHQAQCTLDPRNKAITSGPLEFSALFSAGFGDHWHVVSLARSWRIYASQQTCLLCRSDIIPELPSYGLVEFDLTRTRPILCGNAPTLASRIDHPPRGLGKICGRNVPALCNNRFTRTSFCSVFTAKFPLSILFIFTQD
jgi:hypothetical protein